MNPATKILLTVWASVAILLETQAGPVALNGKPKPPNCPYGSCFIDRCMRICSCISPDGSTSCTNNYLVRSEGMQCPQITPSQSSEYCPYGNEYRSELWTDNFVCYCNNDVSQTYECFDTSTKQSANARELEKLIRKNLEVGAQIVSSASGEKKRSTENVTQTLYKFI